jgi:hypothetical protein
MFESLPAPRTLRLIHFHQARTGAAETSEPE